MKNTRSLRGATLTIAILAVLAMAGAAELVACPAEADDGRATGAGPLDLNRAGIEELVAVPGIGQVMAQRIIDFREEHGPFQRIEDLMKVKGIGEKSFQKLRRYLKVSAKS